MIELESIFSPLFDEYFNGENQVVSKSSAVTTADASDKRQQQPDSTSSTSTLATTITVGGNFDLSYALSWKPCQGDSLNLPDHRSVKTITYESLNNILRLINGISAMLLAIMPGKTNMLEGIHGWELRPSFRGPRLPRWMENGVSSFNQFVHELSVESDSASSVDYSSGEDVDGDEYDDDDDYISPTSPSSQSSRYSRASSYSKRQKNWTHRIYCIFRWLLLPARLMLGIPYYLYSMLSSKDIQEPASSDGSLQTSQVHTGRKALDHFVQRATDRRRGVIEDLHLGMEICIETVFDGIHKVTSCFLSPMNTLRTLLRWSSPGFMGDAHSDDPTAYVATATLREDDPTPTERKTRLNNSLNTDGRTCEDVITELGYPYEAINVVTADGYVLLLERIPRRDARKVVYLQHGVFDSSMGWVSNGVVGSPAFAAFDQGYDVYLGNFRGLVSREHVNKNISSRDYWRYSINENGIEDIPAMIDKIHEVKTSELKSLSEPETEDTNTEQPYKLCSICHSLGGAAILMYIITRRIEQKPHRISRLILLSPAGFHHDSTLVLTSLEYLLLWFAPILQYFVPAFYVPTRFFRMLLNKLARDFHNYPAVGGVVQTLIGYLLGGDSSNWVGVMGLPHYNMNDMPGVSFRIALHLAQMKHARRFRMFDYGSPSANMQIYGSPEPLDLGEYYGLIDIPVDVVAGKKDKVIRPSMVRKHYRLMRDAGVDASYNEFEYAHLDFTFSHREELMGYVMSRLLLVVPNTKHKGLRLKKKDGEVIA
ncbi:AB-hydrolase lipase domain-containing protein [Tanacetum coccineum]|uniref:AB-hydrolase lipase domain-containing protein n=1 Tax=Tanacetum coccineum TaxID=301880 RepID=A0ABQ5AL42_9ASTR